MSPIDEIALRRAEANQAKQSTQNHDQLIQATTNSGRGVVEAAQHLASKGDVAAIVNQLETLQENMLGAFSVLIEVINGQPDFPQLLHSMQAAIVESIAGLDSSEHEAKELELLSEVKNSLEEFSSINVLDPETYKKSQQELLKALKAIKVNPIVNVPDIQLPAPSVTVQERELDFRPLQDTIKEYMTPSSVSEDEGIDLTSYKAQDIKDSGKYQYIGFVNQNGNWYIIENDIKGNSLRYIFGSSNYQEAFDEAANYKYLLLNEAIDALST